MIEKKKVKGRERHDSKAKWILAADVISLTVNYVSFG
jgi:hypothetical protein